MTDESEPGAADTMRERADENRVKLWLLMGANRFVVAGALTAGVFAVFVLAVSTLSPPFTQQIESGDTIETLFSTMITVVVTGTTLVVTIGQLVLTQEEGPLGDQRDRMRNSMDVRDDIEELIGSPSPSDPAEFVAEILAATARRAEALRDGFDGTDDDALRAEVEAITDSVVENAAVVRDDLDGAEFGSFDVVSAALNFNYGRKIVRVERIASEYEAQLDDRDVALLADLKAALLQFAPAREHVKTLYFQWALIALSQQILYAAVPALAVAGVMVGVVDAGTFPGSTFGVDHVVLAVGAAFAVTLLPFMLFVSYLLRILTVAKRTLAIEPLILRDSRR